MLSSIVPSFPTLIAFGRACLKLHAAEANTNYPPQDYESELEAAALLSAVPLSAAGAPGAAEAGNSDDEDARRSELELSAMHGMLQIARVCCDFDALTHLGVPGAEVALSELQDPWCLLLSYSKAESASSPVQEVALQINSCA